MAKKSAKPPAKKAATAAKKRIAPKKSKSTPSKVSASAIEKLNEDILKKLIDLNLSPELQGDIQWCLGSFRFDKNPSGLYLMAERALEILKAASVTQGKSITPKFLQDIEKALKNR